MDIAVVGAAVSLALDADGVCADARVVLGAVAPTAILVPEAAAALVGRKLDETALAGLDQAARRACKPIDDKRGHDRIPNQSRRRVGTPYGDDRP